MAYINIDVDLDEFSTDEPIDALAGRVNKKGRRGIDEKQKAVIMASVREFYDQCGYADLALSVKSIDDQAKLEAVQAAWPKYTAAQIEERLK